MTHTLCMSKSVCHKKVKISFTGSLILVTWLLHGHIHVFFLATVWPLYFFAFLSDL